MKTFIHTLVIISVMTGASCKGAGGDENVLPTGPTPVAPVIPADTAGTTVSQNGCAVTYNCPTADANPPVPTFDRVTLTNGTSSSCRINVPGGGNGGEAPMEVTIRNPSPGFQWDAGSGDARLAVWPLSASTAGPHQATVRLFPGQNSGVSAGQTFVQTLTLQMRRGTNVDSPAVASCAIAVWGTLGLTR